MIAASRAAWGFSDRSIRRNTSRASASNSILTRRSAAAYSASHTSGYRVGHRRHTSSGQPTLAATVAQPWPDARR
jgi:hypothetical protein